MCLFRGPLHPVPHLVVDSEVRIFRKFLRKFFRGFFFQRLKILLKSRYDGFNDDDIINQKFNSII